MSDILTRPGKSARKAKGDGHLRRAEILHAAEAIFVREGYQGATIRRIAEEVGVSSTALYIHFRDKDEILLEICETAAETLLAHNTEIAARPIDAVSRAKLILADYMRFGFANPNTYHLAFGAGAKQVSNNVVAGETSRRCYEQFLRTVADIAAEGRLRGASINMATQLLWSACHGLIALRTTRPDVDWKDDEVLISGMLDGLFAGLATNPSSADA